MGFAGFGVEAGGGGKGGVGVGVEVGGLTSGVGGDEEGEDGGGGWGLELGMVGSLAYLEDDKKGFTGGVWRGRRRVGTAVRSCVGDGWCNTWVHVWNTQGTQRGQGSVRVKKGDF